MIAARRVGPPWPTVLLVVSIASACGRAHPEAQPSGSASEAGAATPASKAGAVPVADASKPATATTAAAGATVTVVDDKGDGNSTIAPPYAPAPELAVDDTVPHGTITNFTMTSSDSAIYPRDVATGEVFTRSVDVYVPQQYIRGTMAPFMVVQDGISLYEATMVPVLDNMIAAGELAPMVAIFVEPGPDEATPTGERSFEYDSVSPRYVDFVETELLPAVQKHAAVSLTTDPEGRAAVGASSGGAAAFTMGWFRPDLYHRILTNSASFCDLQPSPEHPNGAWEYHASLVGSTPAKPLRIALSASENDLDWNTETDAMRRWRDANDGMAAALAKAGYHYRYVYASKAEHIDFGVIQQTLPETLRWLWRGYPVR